MKVYTSRFNAYDPQLACNNFGFFLREGFAKYPENKFIDAATGEIYTGSDFSRLSQKLINSLHAIGIRSGDTFAICCTNTVRTPLLLTAIWSLNAVGSGLDFGFPPDEYIELSSVYEAKAFVCTKANLKVALAVREGLDCIKWIIVIDDDEVDPSMTASGIFTFGYLTSMAAEDAPIAEIQPDLLAYLPRTSGTTGRSKPIMQTHRTMITCILMQSAPDVMPFDKDAKILSSSALHHTYCLIDIFGSCVYRGFDFVHSQTNDVESIVRIIDKYRVTVFFTTPYIVLSILNLFKIKHKIVSEVCLKSLQTLATASNIFPASMLSFLRECLPNLTCFGNLYGQTEICAAFSHSFQGFYKPCAIGQILSGAKFRIVDPKTFEDVPIGERGELWLQSPNLMVGVYKDPEAFKSAVVEGKWLRTGDICYVDDEGYVFLVDRIKEFIKTKYTTISPGEVEAKIGRHPLVKDVAVIGLPHPILQAALHAVIAPNSPDLKEDDIHQFMAENAPDIYKLEGGITFCDAVPRSEMGKLKRRDLVKWVLSKKNE